MNMNANIQKCGICGEDVLGPQRGTGLPKFRFQFIKFISMNSKLAKRIRRWAKDKNLVYARAKRAYEHATEEDKRKIESELKLSSDPKRKMMIIKPRETVKVDAELLRPQGNITLNT